MLAAVTLLVLVFGPLTMGWAAVRRDTQPNGRAGPAWSWRPTLSSALLCTLAYNLTFLLQEVFLVLPKALTPGLRPTLFHNNHTWSGDNPLASLLQGSGALAILVCGVVCGVQARRLVQRSWTGQLLLAWMAYEGCFQALPQLILGAFIPGNDVGVAMTFLGLGPLGRGVAAVVALALLPLVAWWLTPVFLRLAGSPERLATVRARLRCAGRLVTLPALLSVVLSVAFREPRELIEVLLPPAVSVIAGAGWIQALAARARPDQLVATAAEAPVAAPLTGLVALLLLFQLVLRRGIAFY